MWFDGPKLMWQNWILFGVSMIFLGFLYWTFPIDELRSGIRNLPFPYSMPLETHSQNWSVPDNRTSTTWSVDQNVRRNQRRRVAICLVGGLRAFELTGPSIKKYLLNVSDDADVFIHVPIDANVHKLTLLSGVPHLASVRLFVPSKLNESDIAKDVLTSNGSPNGIQGLLQYFSLVEGCFDLIEAYKALYDVEYDWVIRSRVDGFWNAPMPSLDALNTSKYHVPSGSSFQGFNDRIGVGTQNTSRVGLQRMSLLPLIHQKGFRDLNSESSFKAQFTSSQVDVELHQFPFCILSVRRYGYPPGQWGTPVFSIVSKGPLNGAKCRPCTPRLVGEAARKALDDNQFSGGTVGPTDDAQFCDARGGWEKNWEQIYDTLSGPELAEVRRNMTSRSFSDCLHDMERFQRQWEVWNAPAAASLCKELNTTVVANVTGNDQRIT